MNSILTKKQVINFAPRRAFSHDAGSSLAYITAELRYDDACGNGHNTFTITGELYRVHFGRRIMFEGGRIHKSIAEVFPLLAPLIKWHLCSSNGPVHYIANTVFLAGDRDCWGMRAGEFKQSKDRDSGLPLWELTPAELGGNRRVAAAEVPMPVSIYYQPVGQFGEGKVRELDAARAAAIWPDATDEDLTAPGLEERLLARLPSLMAEFRAAIESLGLTY